MQIKIFILCFLYQTKSNIYKNIKSYNLSYIIFHPNFHSLMKNREVKWVLPRVEIEVNTHC